MNEPFTNGRVFCFCIERVIFSLTTALEVKGIMEKSGETQKG